MDHLRVLTLFVFLSFPAVSFGQTTAPALGVAENFAVFSHAGAIASTGSTVVVGDIGTVTEPVAGFAPVGSGVYTGTLHEGDSIATQAQADVQAAFDDLGLKVSDSTLNYATGLGNKQVLKPYIY